MQVQVDDGVTLEVATFGADGGVPLMLVHGFGGAKEDFGDHFAALAERRRVIALDLRGHGDSDKPDDPMAYSLDRLARDVVAVADACRAERIDLLGHSMGGMVARRVALAAPERVQRLVLMDTCPGPIPGFDYEVVDAGAEIALTQGMAELKAVLDALTPLESGPSQRILETRPGYREYCDWKYWRLSPVMWATLVRELVLQPDELHRLVEIEARTLVMVGEADRPFRDPSGAMADTIPDAVLAVIADAGHSPQFEQPAAWLETLESFLT